MAIGFSLVGLALIVIGACIVHFWTTDIQQWGRTTWFGRDYKDQKNQSDASKINWILSWLTHFEISYSHPHPNLFDKYSSGWELRVQTHRLISPHSKLTVSSAYASPGIGRLTGLEEFQIETSQFAASDYDHQFQYFMGRSIDNNPFQLYKEYKWGMLMIKAVLNRQDKIEEIRLLLRFYKKVKRIWATFKIEIGDSNLQIMLPKNLRKKYKKISNLPFEYDTAEET